MSQTPPPSPLKTALLSAVSAVFRVLTSPFVLVYLALGRRGATFQSIMQAACLVPGLPGAFTRQALLAAMAKRCGLRVTVHLGTLFSTADVELAENVYIGAFCNIGHAIVDDYALLGSNVHVLSGKHQHGYARHDVPMALQDGRKVPVRIGYGAWVGNGAIIMADVGEHSIIGAGSVVVDPIPAWSIAVGSPARVVGDRRAGGMETS